MPYQINPFTKELDFYKDSRALINDSGSGPTDIWSAQHIGTLLDEHEHFLNLRIVFKESFVGNGYETQFTLTGAILNGTFTQGLWTSSSLLITLPVNVTNINSGSLYDSANLFTRNRIFASSISAGGTVTLDYAPRDGETFYIWYWYEVQSTNIIEDYIREDFVAQMEADTPGLARDIPVDTTNFSTILSASDTDLQTTLETIDVHTHAALDEITENSDINTGTEVVDSVLDSLGRSCFWSYVIYNGTNVRSGFVSACWVDSTDLVSFIEVSTLDIGDTSDVTLSVDINSNVVRLLATVLSNNWGVKVSRKLL